MPYPALTSSQAGGALTSMEVQLSDGAPTVERREDRWLVRLAGDRLAWFAASAEGARQLAIERRVLGLLAARCSFQTPRVLAVDPEGDFDVRTLVPGTADPWTVFDRVRADPRQASRIGAAVGAILIEQHTQVRASDVAGWLPRRPGWPETRDRIRPRLATVGADGDLLAKADEVLARYEAEPVSEGDRVLVHADLGLHNLAIDPASLVVRGVFDYGGAAWADRHHDFRYLLLGGEDEAMLDAALAVYEPAAGASISRRRVALYNAACALSFLAHRAGTRPEERCCGRTLAEDLAWTRQAVDRTRALAGVGP